MENQNQQNQEQNKQPEGEETKMETESPRNDMRKVKVKTLANAIYELTVPKDVMHIHDITRNNIFHKDFHSRV